MNDNLLTYFSKSSNVLGGLFFATIVDDIAIPETWLNDEVPDSFILTISNFDVLHWTQFGMILVLFVLAS